MNIIFEIACMGALVAILINVKALADELYLLRMKAEELEKKKDVAV